MWVLYVSCVSKVRLRTLGWVAMGSAVLFIFRSRLLLYSARSRVNRVQVVLSGFSARLFCCVRAKTLCRYGCVYFLAVLVLVCVDVIVMSPPINPHNPNNSCPYRSIITSFPSMILSAAC